MFLQTGATIVECGKGELRIKQLNLSTMAQKMAKRTVKELPEQQRAVALTIATMALKASLLAGLLVEEEEDFVYFNGSDDAFIPSLKGIGRLPISKICAGAERLSTEEWVLTVASVMRKEEAFIDSLFVRDLEELESTMLCQTDWPQLMKNGTSLASLLNRFFGCICLNTQKLQKSSIKN